MSEVISLVPPAKNESLVELLEDLLQLAKDGVILEIAGTSMNAGGEFAEFYTSGALDSNCVPFLGYLRVLQMRFERQIEI
jgi:hypothetical protein